MKTAFLAEGFDRSLQIIENNASRIIFSLIGITFLSLLSVRVAGLFIVGTDPWGIMENNVIYSIQRMLKGFLLYGDPESAPFGVTQYSPIYYYIIAGLAKATNVNPDNLLEIYQISRVVSLIFNILFGGAIYLIAAKIFNKRTIIAASVGMLGFILLQRHGYSRPDSLYNLTIVLTIFSYLTYLKNSATRQDYKLLILTSFVAVFSIYTKQSGIILPALLLFYQLMVLRDVKGTAILTVSLGIFFSLFLWLFAGNNLDFFYKNVVRGLDNGIVFVWFWYNIIVDYFCTVPGIIITSISLYSSLLLIRSTEKTNSFLGWSIIALFSFALLTSLKQGSTPSYFTECGALGLVAFLFIKDQIKLPALLSVLIVFLALTAFFMNPKILIPIYGKQRFSEIAYIKEKQVIDYIQNTDPLLPDEKAFIDLNGWEYFMTGIFFEKGLFPNRDIVGQKISFDYSEFKRLKKNSKIKYVISLQRDVQYLDVSFSDYKAVAIINGFYVLKQP